MAKSEISRRFMAAGMALSTVPLCAAAKPPARALALIGDRAHNPDYIRISLDKVFHALNIPIDYSIDYSGLSAAMLKPYQLFLIMREGVVWPDGYTGADFYAAYERNLENEGDFPAAKMVPWMTEEQGMAIKDFVSAGASLYALHDASHISLSCKNFREVMGGAFLGHPPLRPFEVHATPISHPITAGMKSFVVNDEQHYVEYDKDPRYVILESENRDGLTFKNYGTKAVSGWAYDYGKGRVVFTAVGHTVHAMWNPQYLELQQRAVRWLLKDL
jgi:type 1 glutamine amidotransferase